MPAQTRPLTHLAIEATRFPAERRGIGRYVRSLLREFAKQRPSLRFTLFVARTRDVAAVRAELDHLHPTLNTRTWVETVDRLPYTDADVAWYPWNFITVPTVHARHVVTVHDIAPMLQLDGRWWKFFKRAKYRARYARTLAMADGVVTVSQFSREELLEKTDAEAARISVTPLAANDLPFAAADDSTPLEWAGVSGAFFLTVGGQDDRKNLETVYDAMDRLWTRGVCIPLVQCGPSISACTRARMAQSPWLRHVGFVSDAQLVTLYRRCRALLYPSRYEGFGLPVLEAMTAGAPVICSDESSLPEVAGAAARYVSWHDAEEMSHTMQRVALDAPLRAALRAAGRQRATLFAWSTTAQATLLAFEGTLPARNAVALTRVTPELAPFSSREPLTTPTVIGATARLHRSHDH